MSPGTQVLLIQPVQAEYTRRAIFQPGVEIPLNLTSLAAYLERVQIDCRILDLRIIKFPRKMLVETLKKEPPEVIGISAFTPEITIAGRIAEDIKEVAPGIPVVIGGYHATADPEKTMENYSGFDYLVHGEGELVFHEFVSRILRKESVHSVAGVAYRHRGQVTVNPRHPLIQDLDTLPFTQRDTLDLSRYVPKPGTGNFLRLPSTGIMASRGCPYNCYYCSKGVWGTTIRFRSVGHVLAEIERCIERYRIRDFRFYDDALPLPKWDLKGFCQQLIARRLDISWNCYSRVDLVDRDMLQLMKRAGCYHIKYGIEFGMTTSLEEANKRTTIAQAREAVLLTKEAGIECKGNFILGIPGEGRQDCERTIRFAIELSPDLASFYPFYPVPGSVFETRLRRNPEYAKTLMPQKERERLARDAYRLFYLRPGFVLQRLRRFTKYPIREIRVILSALWMMGRYSVRLIIAQSKQL